MATASNGVITAPPKGVVGGNRKKQKRRAKQAARQAAQPPLPAQGQPADLDYGEEDAMGYGDEDEGEDVRRRIGAKKYLECSSLTGEGVDDVFEAATRQSLLSGDRKEGRACCVIL